MGFPSPEEGGPHIEGILREVKYGHRGPKMGQIQRKVSTTSMKIVMQVIKLKSEMFRAGTHCIQTGVSPFKNP